MDSPNFPSTDHDMEKRWLNPSTIPVTKKRNDIQVFQVVPSISDHPINKWEVCSPVPKCNEKIERIK